MNRDRYIPKGSEPEKTLLERFQQMNSWIMRRGAWVVSLPGADVVTIDCLPASSVPDELREAGYILQKLESGQRIDRGAICRVDRYSLPLGKTAACWCTQTP
jgi:hypothetical protein